MRLSHFLRAVFQPHNVYRPTQLFRRAVREWRTADPIQEATLPWGSSLEVDITEHIGRSVWLHGIYGTTVCELLWRLSKPGMKTVDAGANIGVMTNLLAHRVHPSGSVYSFEPHPTLYSSLVKNVRHLRARYDADVYPFPFALHDQSGSIFLTWNQKFQNNHGTASIAGPDSHTTGTCVPCTSLDSLFPTSHVDVLKIDVEGHEPILLSGANGLLSDHRIDHIVYECLDGAYSSLHEKLRRHGYTLFGIEQSMRGPLLHNLHETPPPLPEISSSFLATRHPSYADEVITPNGWKCLMCAD